MTWEPQTGELVWAYLSPESETETPVQILCRIPGTELDAYGVQTRWGSGLVFMADIRPIDVPIPAVGQRWRSHTSGRVVEVVEVLHGGALAFCVTDTGHREHIILPGRYTLITEAGQ